MRYIRHGTEGGAFRVGFLLRSLTCFLACMSCHPRLQLVYVGAPAQGSGDPSGLEIGCRQRNSLNLVPLRASEVCALGDPNRTFPPFCQINWLSAAPYTPCTELAHFARGVHLLLLDNILLLVELDVSAYSTEFHVASM